MRIEKFIFLPTHLLLVFFFAIWFMPVINAQACSCDAHDVGFLADQSIEVPANAIGIMWAGYIPSENGSLRLPPEEHFRLERKSNQGWENAPLKIDLIHDEVGNRGGYDTILVGPENGFAPGGEYRFVFYSRAPAYFLVPQGNSAYRDSQEVFINVSAEKFSDSQVDKEAGAAIHGLLAVSAGGSCTVDISAIWVDVPCILPPELRKWKYSFYYTTDVGPNDWLSLLNIHPTTKSNFPDNLASSIAHSSGACDAMES